MSEKTKHRDRWLSSRPELGRLRAVGGLTRTVVVDGASISKWCTRVGAIYDDVVRRIVEEADAGDRKVILVTSAPMSLEAPHVVVVSALTVARLFRGKAIEKIVTPDLPSLPSVLCAGVSDDRELLDALGVAEHVLDIATGKLWKVGQYDVEFAAEHGTAKARAVPREVDSLARAIETPRKLDRTYIVTQLVRAGDAIELRHVVVDDGVRRGASGHDDSIALLRSALKGDIVPVMTSSMDVLDALYDAGVPLPRAVEDPALASVLLDPDTRAAPPGVGYIWRKLLGKREEGALSFRMDQALDELPSLHADLREELAKGSLTQLYDDDVSPTLPVFASIEREGFYLDEIDLAVDLAYIEDEIAKAHAAILSGTGTAFSNMDIVHEDSEYIAAAILRCDGKPGDGWWTKKPNLERLALSGNTRAQAVQHMRGLYSIHQWMKRIEGTPRLRTILEPKATGRWYPHDKATSALPKHHPDAERLRKHLVPEPGHVFVAGDFKAFEPRLLADQSGDPLLVAGAQPGKDIYEDLMPILAVQTRDLAKKALLGFLFGQSAQRFAWGMPLREKEGRRIFAALEAALTRARSFRDAVQAADLEHSVSMRGWRRLRGSETPAEFKKRAFNLKLQGSAADLLRKLLRDLRDVLPPETRVVHQEFDAVFLSCPKELAPAVGQTLEHAMENVAHLSVPLVATVKYGATLAAIS